MAEERSESQNLQPRGDEQSKTEGRGFRYIAAIDGLRAIAVIAVMLYHLGFSWIPGGFLGVDLFFVISGYVITRLLLDSIQRSGGLDLRYFYFARIRRLLPPLVFMLFSTALFVGMWAPDTIKRFLTDAPFSLTGMMNWWLVFKKQDYFEAVGRPPLLQHTWSLAVEAQFYLVWPLILLFVLTFFGKKRIPGAALAIAFISGIALFVVSMQIDDAASASISHVYFGTDTHSIGLFLGAALAVSWIPQNLTTNIAPQARNFIDGFGFVGLLGMLGFFLFMDAANPTLYRIAFPAAGIFGCLMLTSIVHPASRFAPILRNRVLLWIGERSYSIYLWHWVVFQVTRPDRDLAGAQWAMYSVRILIVFALADISYKLVEVPFRNGTVQGWFRGMKYRTPRVRKRQQIAVGLGCAILVAATSLVSAHAISVNAENQRRLKFMLENPVIDSTVQQQKDGLWVAGDSVILGIKFELQSRYKISVFNARVGRQAPELLDELVRDKQAAGDDRVVINLGNNNKLVESQVAAILEELKDQPLVIIVNTAVPRPWRDHNNELIATQAARYPNMQVVDWQGISTGRPEYFAPDGIHLAPLGATVYVDAILNKLNE